MIPKPILGDAGSFKEIIGKKIGKNKGFLFAPTGFGQRLLNRMIRVVLPTPVDSATHSAVPLFFTPAPKQHQALDTAYDSFGSGWGSLWDDYTLHEL